MNTAWKIHKLSVILKVIEDHKMALKQNLDEYNEIKSTVTQELMRSDGNDISAYLSGAVADTRLFYLDACELIDEIDRTFSETSKAIDSLEVNYGPSKKMQDLSKDFCIDETKEESNKNHSACDRGDKTARRSHQDILFRIYPLCALGIRMPGS